MLRLALLGLFLLIQLTNAIDVDENVGDHHDSLDKTQEEMSSNEPEELRKIFVGALNRGTSDEKFKEYFSQFGRITDGAVTRDSVTQNSRGFGLITFAKVSGADACIARKRAGGHELDGKILIVKRVMPDKKAQTRRIFLGGLKEGITEENVKEYFEANFACKVEKVYLPRTKDQPTELRGFGFLTLDNEDAVDKILIIRIHGIAGIQVSAQRTEERGGGLDRGRGYNRGYGGAGGGGYGRGYDRGYGGGGYGHGSGYDRGYNGGGGYGRGYDRGNGGGGYGGRTRGHQSH